MTFAVRAPDGDVFAGAARTPDANARAPGGLTSAAAGALLEVHGPNEPAPAARRALWRDVLRPLGSPIILILLAASVVAALVGDVVDAAIIVVMVVLGAALDFVQTYRSARAADALRSRVALSATVLRDGEWRDVDRRLLVPGDVVRLTAGDLVPADAELLTARDLHVQQSALTGESVPAEKEAPTGPRSPNASDGDPGDPTLVFLGTSVVSGSATALVTRTGRETRFGDIAARLAMRPPETEFERGLRRFTHLILQTVVFLTLFIALVSIALRRDPLQSLLFAVALAVGLVPEFLPMITTVTLASGAVRMARRHVIVKHLPAIQNLGSIDVLCSDKTGTLTSGDVRFQQAVSLTLAPSERVFALGWVNAHFETGVRSPLDAALLRERAPSLTGLAKLDEIPFDFERRRLTVIVQQDGTRIVSTKGAPEAVLAVCTRYETGETRATPNALAVDVPSEALDGATRARVLGIAHQLSERGQRVLAVAWRRAEPALAYGKADERDLVFAGLLAFRDPPLDGAQETVRRLAADGVRIVVLSGDEAVITRQVCGEVGLTGSDIVTGADVERMTDGALAHVAEQATGFARLTPGQKTRVIAALRSRSHVVGFLGDGINDAPALHAADVGISVCTAADVAKDAADVILMEPGLDVLHAGIIEGRMAFGNTMKYLLMGTSSSFGNMFSMAVASIALPFLPMLPTQILLNNFLYDAAQVTIPTDNVDPEYLARPHRFDMRVLRSFMLGVGPVSSLFDFLTFFVLLKVFHAGAATFHTGWFMESLATQTLVLFSIRTVRSPLRSLPSRALAATVLGVVAVGLVLPMTPLATVLGFVRMPASYYGFIAVATLAYLVLADAVKRPLMRRFFAAQRELASHS